MPACSCHSDIVGKGRASGCGREWRAAFKLPCWDASHRRSPAPACRHIGHVYSHSSKSSTNQSSSANVLLGFNEIHYADVKPLPVVNGFRILSAAMLRLNNASRFRVKFLLSCRGRLTLGAHQCASLRSAPTGMCPSSHGSQGTTTCLWPKPVYAGNSLAACISRLNGTSCPHAATEALTADRCHKSQKVNRAARSVAPEGSRLPSFGRSGGGVSREPPKRN